MTNTRRNSTVIYHVVGLIVVRNTAGACTGAGVIVGIAIVVGLDGAFFAHCGGGEEDVEGASR